MSFLSSRDGNIAIVSALAFPVLMACVGAAVDFHRWGLERARLQEFADTLALRGAREFMLANASPSSIKSAIKAASESDLAAQTQIGAFTLAVAVDDEAAAVTVSLSQPAPRAFLLSHIAPYSDALKVTSTAVARGGVNVCIVALEERDGGAIVTNDSALLDATPCSVLSNSSASTGIAARNRSKIKAGLTCSAGGASGGTDNFDPEPTTDCPVYPDPLAHRPPPPFGGCDFHDFEVGYVISNGAGPRRGGLIPGVLGEVGAVVESVAELAELPLIEQTISPGVYCGGLKVKLKAKMTFRPGVYVIKDGPLEVGEASTLEGENIAFYLVGDDATFHFDSDARITMTAPKTGSLAGILFFEDRSAPLDRTHLIESNDARQFLGTFYLPRGTLKIDTEKPVADASAYTAIVARKLVLTGEPTLVLNADYASTDVPVPGGVGPVGGEVFLRGGPTAGTGPGGGGDGDG